MATIKENTFYYAFDRSGDLHIAFVLLKTAGGRRYIHTIIDGHGYRRFVEGKLTVFIERGLTFAADYALPFEVRRLADGTASVFLHGVEIVNTPYVPTDDYGVVHYAIFGNRENRPLLYDRIKKAIFEKE